MIFSVTFSIIISVLCGLALSFTNMNASRKGFFIGLAIFCIFSFFDAACQARGVEPVYLGYLALGIGATLGLILKYLWKRRPVSNSIARVAETQGPLSFEMEVLQNGEWCSCELGTRGPQNFPQAKSTLAGFISMFIRQCPSNRLGLVSHGVGSIDRFLEPEFKSAFLKYEQTGIKSEDSNGGYYRISTVATDYKDAEPKITELFTRAEIFLLFPGSLAGHLDFSLPVGNQIETLLKHKKLGDYPDQWVIELQEVDGYPFIQGYFPAEMRMQMDALARDWALETGDRLTILFAKN